MNHSRLLALFTVCIVIGIGLAAGATHAIGRWSVPERHHTYWCHISVIAVIEGMPPARYTMSLPCKYRTNTPVDV